MSPSAAFDHEQLHVYQVAAEFAVIADSVAGTFPARRAYLRDQLRRASLSIPLNIAEGAGEYSLNDKKRFYRMAQRSAAECAAILDLCQRLGLVNRETYLPANTLLHRTTAMLIALCRIER